MKRKAKDGLVEFRYLSPLAGKPNEIAKQIAELAEQSMLETFDIMLSVIEQRSLLFYNYACRKIDEEQKRSVDYD